MSLFMSLIADSVPVRISRGFLGFFLFFLKGIYLIFFVGRRLRQFQTQS